MEKFVSWASIRKTHLVVLNGVPISMDLGVNGLGGTTSVLPSFYLRFLYMLTFWARTLLGAIAVLLTSPRPPFHIGSAYLRPSSLSYS
jgi:hypothetical protein